MNAKPQVVVVAGPNGAGKSTAAPDIVRNAFGVNDFVNADAIALGLSQFAPEQVAFAAGRVFLERISALFLAREDFAFETTLSAKSLASVLSAEQRNGYVVHVIFLWLPSAEMAVERVARRVRNGGHSIPKDVVRRRYDRGISNFFNIYRQIADSWVMLDNSAASAPRAIAWRNLGGPVNVVRTGPWQELRERYEQDIV